MLVKSLSLGYGVVNTDHIRDMDRMGCYNPAGTIGANKRIEVLPTIIFNTMDGHEIRWFYENTDTGIADRDADFENIIAKS